MRRRYRDINVFNLSMLDVIASAMGAFLIIMVIIIPYFNKESQRLISENQQLRQQVQQQQQQIQSLQQQIQQLLRQQATSQDVRRQLERLQQQIQQQQQQIQQQQRTIEQQRQQNAGLQREVQALRQRLAKTFLIIIISWKTPKHDVDLHVVDPAGHEFWYKKKSYPNVPGELSEDAQIGPGQEVWVITQAPPGDYKIYYNLYNPHGNMTAPAVNGMVYHRDGYNRLPQKVLTRIKQKVFVATVTVKPDGSVVIR
ncbi:MAG: hypothetical protein AB1814_13210 [Thermodesulfobacteriota bacterium]